ncbi:hypothetical protein GQ53DRAFT_706035 [Thozetella sp. PMI_491]|nr:hypothetical protein GQ53DRAFT_706035 [Thozetella sp. PMI_491]
MRQSDDPSWNYCGLVASAAMQMGLNDCWKKLKPHEIPSDDTILRLKTWIGCFVVTSSLAADLGLPPPMHMVAGSEPIVRQLLEGVLPKGFLSRSHLLCYSVRTVAALYNCPSSPLQSSLIDVLDGDLDRLRDTFLEPVNLCLHIDFLAAKLRLYALPILSADRADMGIKDALSRVVWFKGFHIALRMATLITEPGQDDHSRHAERVQTDTVTPYYPKHYLRLLVMAAIYLLNFLAICQDMSPRDKVLARNRVKRVYETLNGWSRSERDEPDRTAKLLELLSLHAEDTAMAAYFTEAEPTSIPTIVENGLMTAGKIRQLKHSESRDSARQSLTARQSRVSIDSTPVLQPMGDIVPEDPISPDWDAWLSAANDTMDLLGSQSSSLLFPTDWVCGQDN